MAETTKITAAARVAKEDISEVRPRKDDDLGPECSSVGLHGLDHMLCSIGAPHWPRPWAGLWTPTTRIKVGTGMDGRRPSDFVGISEPLDLLTFAELTIALKRRDRVNKHAEQLFIDLGPESNFTMSATTTLTTEHVESLPTTTLKAPRRMQVDGTDPTYGDWRDDLIRDGFAVIKGAVPRERADKYADAMYSWLESFNLGFRRNDLSTVHRDNLPAINEKGMCLQYAVTHEDFAWAIRSEPGVVGAFEKVYATDDLIVSFDAVNFGFPGRKDLPPNSPWPHQDQDPAKPGFRCLQGLVNLLPNGPDDGGLIVCRGGHLFSEEFHREFANEERIPAWTPEWYGFTENGMKYLNEKGYKWEKLCADPGDLLVWDSRTPHYNLSSKTTQPRFAVYTCYMPVADATQEELIRKKDAYERWVGTTHWPNARHTGSNVAKRDGEDDPHNRFEPINKPKMDGRTYKLTGIPYIKA